MFFPQPVKHMASILRESVYWRRLEDSNISNSSKDRKRERVNVCLLVHSLGRSVHTACMRRSVLQQCESGEASQAGERVNKGRVG